MDIDFYWIGTKMKEWKVSQKIYHALNQDFKDDLNNVDIVTTDDVVGQAVRHFYEKIDQWIYPSKSFFVAICYAKWISEDFGDDFYETLDDPDLLYGNDPYFVPYRQNQKVYDAIIDAVGLDFDQTSGMVPDVREYYDEECHFSYA